jgi:hypothetical protein
MKIRMDRLISTTIRRSTGPLEGMGPGSQLRRVDLALTAVSDQRIPWLPAGPFRAAPTFIGKALCNHNALIEVEHYLRRHDL